MIHVQINTAFEADENGPEETFVQTFVLPPSFAGDARKAHERLLTLIATEDYFELPEHGVTGPVPMKSETVRLVAVWEQ